MHGVLRTMIGLVATFSCLTCAHNLSVAQEKDEVLYKGKPASFWIKQLKDRDMAFRLEAIQALAEIGSDADGAITALVAQAHKDKEEGVRKAASEALRKLPLAKKLPEFVTILYGKDAESRTNVLSLIEKEGIKARAAVPHLIECLKGEPPIRLAALKALGECGKDSIAAIDAVYALKKTDPEDAVRQAAITALDKLGPAAKLPALVEALYGFDLDRKIEAAKEVADLGITTFRATDALTLALKDKDARVRIHAAKSLFQLGKPRTAVDVLIDALAHDDSSVRATGATFLGSMGQPAFKAGPALGKCLTDKEEPVRACAREALKKLGHPAFGFGANSDPKVTVSALIAALKNKDGSKRLEAVMALGKWEADATDAVPELIEALKDDYDRLDVLRALDDKIKGNDFVVRKGAVLALGKIGPLSKEAIPLLEKFIAEPANKPYREWASNALVAIHTAKRKSSVEEIPSMVKTLQGDSEDAVKIATVADIAAFGSKAKEAIPSLVKTLEAKNGQLRDSAADALLRVGVASIPPLIEALDDKKTRRLAAKVLGNFGAKAKTAVPTLMKMIDDEGDRHASIEALGKIGPEAKEANPLLLNTLRTSDITSRVLAADALARMGRNPNSVALLEDALNHRDVRVQLSAARALRKLIPTHANAIKVLVTAVKSKEPLIQVFLTKQDVEALAGAHEAVPVLIDLLTSKELPLMRGAAAHALSKMRLGMEDGDKVRQLMQNKDTDTFQKTCMASALWNSTNDPAFLKLLLAAMGSDEKILEVAAGTILANPYSLNHALSSNQSLSVELSGAIGNLIYCLDKQQPQSVRILAMKSLASFGQRAIAAKSALQQMMTDQDTGLRINAALALRAIDTNDLRAAKTGLLEVLNGSATEDWQQAAATLWLLDDADAAPILLLIERLDHKEPAVRELGAQLLVQLLNPHAQYHVHPSGGQPIPQPIPSLPQVSLEDHQKKTHPILAKALRDEDATIRASAALSIYCLGSKGGWAKNDLLQALKDKDAWVRTCAAYALAGMIPDAKEIVPALLEARKDAEVRFTATYALGTFGTGAKEAIPALIESLKQGDANAARALSRMGKPAIAQLVEIMTKEMRFRQIAGQTLGLMGPEAKEAIPALLEILKEEKAERPTGKDIVEFGPQKLPFVNVPSIYGQPGAPPMPVESLVKSRTRTVLNVLVAIGADADAAIPALIGLMKDQDEDIRATAAITIMFIGPRAKDAVPVLVTSLDDKANMVCWRSLKALQEIGGPALPAIPALIELAKGKRSKEPPNGGLFADHAKYCIAKIMQKAKPRKEALPVLIAVLQEKGFAVDCLDALAKLGPDAKAAIPAIRPYLFAEDLSIAAHVAGALLEIDGEMTEYVAVLKSALHEIETRRFATDAMFRLGKISREDFVAFHESRLQDREEFVQNRLESARILRKMGKASEQEVPALIDLLESGIGGWQVAAIEAIAEIGPDAKGTLPYLTTLLQKNQGFYWPTIRVAVCKALPTLGADAKAAVPALLRTINDDHPHVRWNAVQALIAIDIDAAKKAGVR